jgi:hypothetical protein
MLTRGCPTRFAKDAHLLYGPGESWRIPVSTENWAEERDRLRALLSDFESGKGAEFEIDDGDAVKPATNDERISLIRKRLAALEDRLGDSEAG